MDMTSDTVTRSKTWVDLLQEHKRKTKWTCACGWDGREESLPPAAIEHEEHIAAYIILNIRHYEGSIANILRNLFVFEAPRGRGDLRPIEPRYHLTFRNTASISRPARGMGGFGAAITAIYFDDRGEVPVADLSHDGHRWVITPHKKADHGEVLKLQGRIGTDVWVEPDA